MIKFHIDHPVVDPEGLIQESLRAYHILLGIATSNGVVPVPEATDAAVDPIDGDETDVFVYFKDSKGSTITAFELCYSSNKYWYICNYCDGVPTGVAALRKYAGESAISFSDFRTLQFTLEHIIDVEQRNIIKADIIERKGGF